MKRRCKNFIKLIAQASTIAFTTTLVFSATDLLITSQLKTRGFSQFYETSAEAGFINKRNFSGIFGGPLDDFSAKVNFTKHGTRLTKHKKCSPHPHKEETLIIVGDSMTAGLEVDDDKTYSSLISSSCKNNFKVVNGGVRAHDTHMAAANSMRIAREISREEKRPSILYILTENDFDENDNKNKYASMKSKFGYFHDMKYYAPARDQLKNDIRMTIGDKMYMTTKLLVLIERLKHHAADSIHLKSNQPQKMSHEECIDKATRALDIYERTISSSRNEHKFYIAIHPSTSRFHETRRAEDCIGKALIGRPNRNNILLLHIHKHLAVKDPTFINDPLMRFPRDSHYSEAGHRRVAKALESLLLETSKKQGTE